MPRGRKSYRARSASFTREHGTTIGQAQTIARALGTPTRSAARTIDKLTTTTPGLRVAQDILSGRVSPYRGHGADARNAQLRVAVEDALYRRQLEARALDDVRRGVYTSRAAAEDVYGLPSGTIARRFGAIDVSRPDRAPVAVKVPTPDGERWVITRGSQARADAFAAQRAVIHYRRTGDTSQLDAFKGRRIGGAPIVTNPKEIDRLYEQDRLVFGET
jgi:hypothetical protein